MFLQPGVPILKRPPATGGFSPTGLGDKLKAWWTADDHGTANMTDDGAGLISSWIDRTGALALTATTTARPTWTSTAFSSAYAGLTFDGVANCLVAVVMGGLPTGATSGEIWALVDQTATTGDGITRVLLRYGGITGGTLRSVERLTNARARATDGTTAVTDVDQGLLGRTVVSGTWDGAIEAGRLNGRPFNPLSVTIATLNTGTTRVRMGAQNATAAASFWQGVIRHVIVTLYLTPLQRQQLEAWLAWDANLPSLLPHDHPFRYERP